MALEKGGTDDLMDGFESNHIKSILANRTGDSEQYTFGVDFSLVGMEPA